MARIIPSWQRLVLYLIITLILTIGTLYIFHQFIAGPISLSKLIEQAVEIIIIVVFWSAAIVIIRRFKPLMTQRIGNQAATIVQYVMLAIAILIMTLRNPKRSTSFGNGSFNRCRNNLDHRRSSHIHICRQPLVRFPCFHYLPV